MTKTKSNLAAAQRIVRQCYPSVDINNAFDLVNVALAALKTNERDSTKPPAHWTPDPESERHPQTADEWNWRLDSYENDALERSTKRLNFMADLADPAAPDQMAIVNRIDLMRVTGNCVWLTAKTELYGKILAERNALIEKVAVLEQREKDAFYTGCEAGLKCYYGGNIRANWDIAWEAFQVKHHTQLATDDTP